jgi:dihydroflavonol-4-reductase
VVVLNPGDVAGPYDANNWGRLFFLLRDGALPAVGSGTVTLTHVHDVVRAHLAAVDRGRNAERYLLAGEDHELAELAAEMAGLSGAKVPMKAPAWVLKVYGRIAVMIAALTGKEPDVTPELAEIAGATGATYRSDKATRELGYRIQPMSVAVRDTYNWLVKEGLLQTP